MVLRDIENLHREVARLSRPRSVIITPTLGGSPVEVAIGDEVEITYGGEVRHVRILAVTPTAIRAWDLDKSAIRAFRYDRIGGAAGEGTPAAEETDEPA